MNNTEVKKPSAKKTVIIIIASVLAFTLIAFCASLLIINMMTKESDKGLIDDFKSDYGESETETNGNLRTFGKTEYKYGLVFFGKDLVDPDAYIPLLSAIAGKGIFVVQVLPTMNVSGLSKADAERATRLYPTVESWFVGGHASGALTAAQAAYDNPSDFKGVALVGSHCDTDLTAYGQKVLALFGSEDKIMNKSLYEQNKDNFPEEGFKEYILDGANHSNFGMYGVEEGDGEATLENYRQILIGAEIIGKFVTGYYDNPLHQ